MNDCCRHVLIFLRVRSENDKNSFQYRQRKLEQLGSSSRLLPFLRPSAHPTKASNSCWPIFQASLEVSGNLAGLKTGMFCRRLIQTPSPVAQALAPRPSWHSKRLHVTVGGGPEQTEAPAFPILEACDGGSINMWRVNHHKGNALTFMVLMAVL